MPFCKNCGKQLESDERYCVNCGAFTGSTANSSEIHKCPNCGDNINSFATHCPSCGYEVRDIQAVSSVKEFADKLEAIEASRIPCASKKISMYKQAYMTESLSSTDQQKISLIRSYAIPNTKEDLYEFLTLAGSNINPRLFDEINNPQSDDPRKAINDAWLAQFEHAYQKAKISFGNDPSFESVKELYESVHNKIKRNKRKLPIFLIATFGTLFLFCAILFISTAINNKNNNETSPTGEIITSINDVTNVTSSLVHH